MNLRLIMLFVLVLVSGSASVWVYYQTHPSEAEISDVFTLNQELATAARDMQRIKIENHEGVLFAAVKDTDRWIATHLDTVMTFPVNMQKLAKLASDLSNTDIVELKTSQLDFYHRLAVENIRDEDAQSVLIEIGGQRDVVSLLVGHAAAGGRGTYARQPENDTSVLVDKIFHLPENTSAWLSRDILPFSQSDVTGIDVAVNGASVVSLLRLADDDEGWQLANQLATETLRYPAVVGQTVENMLAFNFEQVRPYVASRWNEAEQLSETLFILNNGSTVSAYLNASEPQGRYLLRFELPGGTAWFTEWIFVLSESQARSFLIRREMLVAP